MARHGLPLVAALALALAVAPGVALAHGGDDGFHHHDGWAGMHDGWAGAWGPVWTLGWLLVLAALVVGAVMLVRRVDAGGRSERTDAAGGTDDAALATLRERYARGEVDDDEFQRRRERLRER